MWDHLRIDVSSRRNRTNIEQRGETQKKITEEYKILTNCDKQTVYINRDSQVREKKR